MSLCAKADSAVVPLPLIATPLSQAIITGGRETTSRDIRSSALDLAEWLRFWLTAASVFFVFLSLLSISQWKLWLLA